MNKQEPSLTPVHLNAREISPPSTISPEAQKSLSTGAASPATAWPSPDQTQDWRELAASSCAMWDENSVPILAGVRSTFETTTIAGALCYDCRPQAGEDANSPVYLFIHGGAFVVGDGAFAKVLGARAADELGLRTVSVDYRMPPEHPFPAALDDCIAVYIELLKTVEARRIIIGGGSAGGNIAAAITLMIRDRGLPLPAGVILLTPEVDLTEAGDSFRTNEDLDVVLKRGLPECNALYANGHDLRDPYLSPLFADFTKGFPPTLIQSGTRDLFLSNSVLIHRKLRDAGIDAELHVWEAMPHGGFHGGDAPENAAIQAELARFIGRITG